MKKVLISTFYTEKFAKIYNVWKTQVINKVDRTGYQMKMITVGPGNSDIQEQEAQGGEAVVEYGLKAIEIVAKDIEYDYLYISDANCVMPTDCITKLLAHNADIVGASVAAIGDPMRCIAHEYAASGDLVYIMGKDFQAHYDNRVLEMGAIAIGAILVKREVFEKIGFKNFKGHFGYKPKNDYMGVSQWFCEQYTNLYKKKPLLDGRVKPKHITIDGKWYRLWGEEGKMEL